MESVFGSYFSTSHLKHLYTNCRITCLVALLLISPACPDFGNGHYKFLPDFHTEAGKLEGLGAISISALAWATGMDFEKRRFYEEHLVRQGQRMKTEEKTRLESA